MSNGLGNSKGLTLIEVLVAVIFLAIGLLAIARLQMTSVGGTAFSHHLTQATYLAQDGMEVLKNLPFESAQLNGGHYRDAEVTAAGIVFRREYDVSGDPSVRTITYTVTWNDGKDHRMTVSTIRSQ